MATESASVSVDEVVEIVVWDPVVIQSWVQVADRLGLTPGTLDPLRRQYNSGNLTVYDLFKQIMVTWVANKGTEATLRKLATALGSMRCRDCAEKVLRLAHPTAQIVIARNPTFLDDPCNEEIDFGLQIKGKSRSSKWVVWIVMALVVVCGAILWSYMGRGTPTHKWEEGPSRSLNEIIDVRLVTSVLIEDERLVGKWKEFRNALGIPASETQPWEMAYRSSTMPVYELFYNLLASWKSLKGREATVKNLCRILDNIKVSCDQLRFG